MSDDIVPCPTGHFCEEVTAEGTGAYDLRGRCPAGTFNPDTHAVDITWCQTCPPGKYCKDTGLFTPDGSCDAGYFCLVGSASEAPAAFDPIVRGAVGFGYNFGPCIVGHYCPLGTSVPIPCPIGTFSPNEKNILAT